MRLLVTCEDCQDLLLPYAAGALDADEAAKVRAHLTGGCRRCAVELAEAEATVAQLPLALEPIRPSPGARAKLMDRLNKPAPAMRIAQSPPLARSRSGLRLAAAACIGALLAGATVQWLSHQVYQPRVARAEAERAALLQQLADQNVQLAQLQQIVNSPSLRLATFQPTEVQRDAHGRILWDREQNKWHISVFNMAPPRPGEAYELWFFGKDSKPVPGPMLRVDATGSGSMTVDVPRDIGPITLAALTNEPEQGVASPTGQIHLKSEIAP